jgi:hypothetical protein
MKFIIWCSNKIRTDEYLESHHILPKAKSLFPEYKSFKMNPWNEIKLTGQEHFIAHWLLWKSHGKFMAYAFSAMKRKSKVQKDRCYNINGKVYEQLRKDVANSQSTRIISEETHSRMSISQRNREKITCPHCNKSGNSSNMTRWHFDNCKVFTGKEKHIVKQNHEIITCPHCNKSGKAQGMLATHFDKCPTITDFRKIKTFFDCPHCLKHLPDTENIKNQHYDNCPKLTGKTKPQSIKSKAANKQRGQSNTGVIKPKVCCPHCDKIGGKPVMLRFHFDNCKFKN